MINNFAGFALGVATAIVITCGNAGKKDKRKERFCTVTELEDKTGAIIKCPDGSVVTIKNGTAGTDGIDGIDGTDGQDGMDGMDGADGADGRDGRDGRDSNVNCTVTYPEE